MNNWLMFVPFILHNAVFAGIFRYTEIQNIITVTLSSRSVPASITYPDGYQLVYSKYNNARKYETENYCIFLNAIATFALCVKQSFIAAVIGGIGGLFLSLAILSIGHCRDYTESSNTPIDEYTLQNRRTVLDAATSGISKYNTASEFVFVADIISYFLVAKVTGIL